MFYKSICPVCKSNNYVRIYDKGLKLLFRFFIGNNRFICRKCKITWRRKNPGYYFDLGIGIKGTQNGDKPYSKKYG